MNKSIKYKIVLFVAILFIAILLPQGLYKQSQIQQIAIVSGIGIDRDGEELEVSVSILVPKPSSNYAPSQTISSAKGKNLPDAINSIEIKIGQELGLAHCYIIILGDEFTKKDVTKDLDYLMRSNIMGNNSAILHTDKKAKEILEVNSALSEQNIQNLQNIAKFNQEHYNSSNTNLINLFNDYLENHSCSIMGSITLENSSNASSQSENSEQSQQQNNNQNSSSKSNQTLSNKGDVIVVKNGKKLLKLTKEEIGYFSWLDTKSQSGYLTINNFFDESLQDATITLKLKHETASFNASIQNDTPILHVNIGFECFVENISSENNDIQSIHKYMLTDNFKNMVKDKIDNDIQNALQISKENNFDAINVYHVFNNKLNKKWKEFLNNLDNPENYIQKLLIVVDVKMESKF